MNATARKFVFSGFAFWVAVAIIGTYLILPIRQKVRLGIDLVGGTYITLEVQTDKAVEAELVEIMQSLPNKLKLAQKPLPVSKNLEKDSVIFTFDSVGSAQDAAQIFKTEDRNIQISASGAQVTAQLSEHKVKKIKDDAVKSNIEVLRARLDTMSVAEIVIAQQGEKNIIVELPDVSDPMQAKAMIGRAAKMEFKLVEKEGDSEEDILYQLDGSLPADKQIIPGREEGGRKYYYLVSKYSELTGSMLREASAGLGGQTGAEVAVKIKFSPEGAQRFASLTSRSVGKRLAIVLDDVVITAPSIREPIKGGNCEITGGMRGSQEAHELALLLKSGAFVAPVTFEEERQIGPSLGAESIRQGFISCAVGLAALFVFSIWYYSVSGLLAFIALLFNLLLVMLGMSWLRATLTLPGIAGMVLTVGMAIDASILIYERIKDELAAGVTTKAAVSNGFSTAMSVILDANITTFIVGVVLYKFGTGPIQGFAVTMMIGIITTLITGLFFLRSLFSFVLETFNVQKLRI